MAKAKPQLISIKDGSALNDCMRELKEITIRTVRAKAKADEKIKRATEELTAATFDDLQRSALLESSIEAYATANYDKFFGETRTLSTPHGDIGFRKTPAAVELLLKKTDDVISAIKRKGKKFLDFIAVKETINKNVVKAWYDNGDVKEKELAGIGLAVTEGDKFFITLAEVETGA